MLVLPLWIHDFTACRPFNIQNCWRRVMKVNCTSPCKVRWWTCLINRSTKIFLRVKSKNSSNFHLATSSEGAYLRPENLYGVPGNVWVEHLEWNGNWAESCLKRSKNQLKKIKKCSLCNIQYLFIYLFICPEYIARVHYIRVTLLRKKYFLFAGLEYILHMISYILKLLTNS